MTLEVRGEEPPEWIVALSRQQGQVTVYLTTAMDTEENEQRKAEGKPSRPPRTHGWARTVKPKKLGKTIEKAQALADKINAEQQEAYRAMRVAGEVDKLMTNVKNSWHGRKGWMNDEPDDD